MVGTPNGLRHAWRCRRLAAGFTPALLLCLALGSQSSWAPSTAPLHAGGVDATTHHSGTPACRAVTPVSATLSLALAGHRRVVIVHVPAGHPPKDGFPLVLNLHGSDGTARQEELVSGMDAAADRDGFVVAYPQAAIPGALGGYDWNVPGVPLFGGALPPRGAADDVAFLRLLVAQLTARDCVDRRRVYATGISGGGRMASQLACDAAGTFAAVAPVAGLRFPSPCPSERPVPVIAFHGSADPVDPYGGHGEAYWTYSVPTAAGRWAAHDRCSESPSLAHGRGYTLTAYGRCAGGSAVELYTLAGEGHEWPGGPKLPVRVTALLGPQSDAVDANSAMWSFFRAHPLPG